MSLTRLGLPFDPPKAALDRALGRCDQHADDIEVS